MQDFFVARDNRLIVAQRRRHPAPESPVRPASSDQIGLAVDHGYRGRPSDLG